MRRSLGVGSGAGSCGGDSRAPLGDEVAGAELAWQLRELAERHGGWTVFYEVSTERLPLYIDLGLSLLKIGEEAIVHLDTFNLEGGHRKGLRRALTDAEKKDVSFAVVAEADVGPQVSRCSGSRQRRASRFISSIL